MKRFISILTAALVLLSIIALPASASSAVRFYVTGPASASVGETVKYALHIEGNYQAHVLNVKLSFNVGSFAFVEVNGGDADRQIKSDGGFVISDLTQDRNAVSYGVIMVDEPTSAQGVLFEATFTVLATATSKPKFTVEVTSFGYMPVGATQQTPIGFNAEDFTVSVSGGSGASTTPVPGPGQFTQAPLTPTQRPTQTDVPTPAPTLAPGETPSPIPTQNGSQGGDVTRTSEAPANTDVTGPDDPGESEAPTEEPVPGTEKNTLKPVFIIVIACLGVLLAALIVFLVIRSSKEKNRRN